MISQSNSNMAVIVLKVESDDIYSESDNKLIQLFDINWDDWPDYYQSSFGRIGLAVLSVATLKSEVLAWTKTIGINVLDPTHIRFDWKIIEQRILDSYRIELRIIFYEPKYATLFRLAWL